MQDGGLESWFDPFRHPLFGCGFSSTWVFPELLLGPADAPMCGQSWLLGPVGISGACCRGGMRTRTGTACPEQTLPAEGRGKGRQLPIFLGFLALMDFPFESHRKLVFNLVFSILEYF